MPWVFILACSDEASTSGADGQPRALTTDSSIDYIDAQTGRLADASTVDASTADGPVVDAFTVDTSVVDASSIDASLPDARRPFTANVVFVTSETYTPADINGLAGADNLCNLHAQQADLPGNYVAYISTSTVNARDRLVGSRGWQRTDHKPVLDKATDTFGLGKPAMFYPVGLNEWGDDMGEALVITGGPSGHNGTCEDFTSNAVGLSAPASTATSTVIWGGETVACNGSYHLYCFGKGRNAAIALPPATGRRAFQSDRFAPGGGVVGADAQCQAEANAANLNGTFKALIATDAASAISRFNLQGTAWMRTDGVPLVERSGDLATGKLVTALSVDATGTFYRHHWVWTGSVAADESSTETCADWTSTSAQGRFGVSHETSARWFSEALIPCSLDLAVYCLEE